MKIKTRLIFGIVFCILFSLSCKKAQLLEETFAPLPGEDRTNIAYGDNAKQVLDLYLPENRTSDTKVVILIHGGFWNAGDKGDISLFVKFLQNSGFAVANINYRLTNTPENNIHPAQINDIKKAIEFISLKATEWNISHNKFALIGFSSGAHLALLYTYAFNTDNKVKTVVSIAGPTNLTDQRNVGNLQKLAVKYLLGKTPAEDPALYVAASPITHVSATSKPTYLIHGKVDVVVPYQQAIDLKNKLNSFNVPNELNLIEGAGHENVITPVNVLEVFGKVLIWLNTHVK